MTLVLRYQQLACLLAGAWLLGLAIRNAIRGSASRRWQQAPGRILRSFVLVESSGDGDGYTPKVEYQYAVAGITYKGARLRFGQTGAWTRGQAERTIARYSPGSVVQVSYDPSKPAEAVLISGVGWGNIGIGLAGAVFLAVALALFTADSAP